MLAIMWNVRKEVQDFFEGVSIFGSTSVIETISGMSDQVSEDLLVKRFRLVHSQTRNAETCMHVESESKKKGDSSEQGGKAVWMAHVYGIQSSL